MKPLVCKFDYSVKESQIVADLTKYFKSESYNVRSEVPNFSQSVDLVLTRGRWVTLIEVKVRDWKTAIYQCRAHEHVADFCVYCYRNNRSFTPSKT